MSKPIEEAVAAHYARRDLLGSILAALEASGGDPARPTIESIAGVDEFHTAGRTATLRALDLTPLEPDMRVLDAGCGIGGTARVLAAERGCRVTGVDLTAEFVETARGLSARMGLSDRCRFELGSVLDLPFEPRSFDAAVTFHVAMNVADRARFYGELARVLCPGAPLCVFDVMKGPTPGMVYPVPWAETEATSFLRSTDETCDLLRAAGFEIGTRSSLRELALELFQKRSAGADAATGPPPLGLHLLTGPNGPEKFANYVQALEASQIEPVIVVARLA